MTLLALLADIHGNREALDACLADAQRRGAEKLIFLGDLIGYGADPAYVVDLVADGLRDGALAILGNHDSALVAGCDGMNSMARAAIEWTQRQLDKDQRNFLASLPITAEHGDLLFVHADAAAPRHWTYVTSARLAQRSLRATPKRVTFCGHVHRPQLYGAAILGPPSAKTPPTGIPISVGGPRKWLAVLGSVGQPRDDNPAAAYAIYDDTDGRLTFLRVAYDIQAAAEKIRAAGLPDFLAARLFAGR